MYRFALFLVSAGLFAASYPASPFPWLVCFALAPAMLATVGLGARQGGACFLLGFWLWWLGALWWAVPALMAFSGASLAPGLLTLVLACLLQALPYGLFGYLVARFGLWGEPFAVPRISLLFAVLVGVVPALVPANPVASLSAYPLLVQWADVGGMPLLLFLYCAFNAALVQAWRNRRNGAGLLTAMATLVLVPAIVVLYGNVRLSAVPPAPRTAITIGYVQPMATPDTKLSKLVEQTLLLQREHAPLDLVIWPEVPIQFSWTDNTYDRYRIAGLVREVGAPFIIASGYDYVNGENPARGYYNSASFVSRGGEEQGRYTKQYLVPFFEYLPWKQLSYLYPEARDYTPGSGPVAYRLDDGITLAPLICYEILFSELLRPYVQRGASAVVNLSNDSWFGAAGGLAHITLARLRAVEYGIPIIRVANSGASLVVDRNGRIVGDSVIPIGREGVRVLRLALATAHKTLFYYLGPYIDLLGLLLLPAALWNGLFYRLKSARGGFAGG